MAGGGRATGVIGAEALIRWQNPELGIIPPSEFIPLAEENGLIIGISEWVLEAACRQNKIWQEKGLPPIRIGVNLSSVQFQQAILIETIERALTKSGLEPSYLKLEITESMIMDNVERSIVTLEKLKSMGMTLALDDFGTGHSSLNYLRRFPLDILKIDRSFIK